MEKKLVRKANKIFQVNRKRFYQSVISKKDQKSILFIVGCQRSGNSMMQNIFNKDLNTKCYHEFSEISSNDPLGGIRLNSLDLVKKEFSTLKAPLIVLKPLVESQNVPELLSYFDNSLALWMFRNYKDVALSNIKRFGVPNGINDLRPIVNGEPDNWRSEKVADHVRNTVAKYFSEGMNPYDAAVLFWWARNSIFFDLELGKHPRVMMCSYEDFVLGPEAFVKGIYQRLGQPYPATNITAEVHPNSREKGKNLELSPAIEQLALEMQAKLESAYRDELLKG
jgi:hypothetical protein